MVKILETWVPSKSNYCGGNLIIHQKPLPKQPLTTFQRKQSIFYYYFQCLIPRIYGIRTIFLLHNFSLIKSMLVIKP